MSVMYAPRNLRSRDGLSACGSRFAAGRRHPWLPGLPCWRLCLLCRYTILVTDPLLLMESAGLDGVKCMHMRSLKARAHDPGRETASFEPVPAGFSLNDADPQRRDQPSQSLNEIRHCFSSARESV